MQALLRSEDGSICEESLVRALSAFITAGDASDEAFDTHARSLFSYQYARNAPYRHFCSASGVSPDTVRHWREIPAAPAAAFKYFELSCTSVSDARVFRSSGTTGRTASRHYLSPQALGLYRISLRAGFDRFVLEDGARLPIWALLPPPEAAPESSLSYMVGTLMATDPHPAHRFFWRQDGPDAAALASALSRLSEPVVLFGTAFAWMLAFDAIDQTFILPEGSLIIETGGFKGRSRSVPREALYALFTERLGVPERCCLSEYGMSEMCSQFYDSVSIDSSAGAGQPRRKLGPPWTRTRVIDPRTGCDAPTGEAGVLYHYDLANLNSVLAIATEDMGCAIGDGFVLLGRAPGAEMRGCSLTVEEWRRDG